MIIMGRGRHHTRLAAPPVVLEYWRRGPEMQEDMGSEAIMERVLIIDDHPLVRDGLRSVVAVSIDGCEIHEASSLEEALAILGGGGGAPSVDASSITARMSRSQGYVCIACATVGALSGVCIARLTSHHTAESRMRLSQ